MLKTQTPHAWTSTVRQHPYPSGARLMVAVRGRSPASVTSNHRNPPERIIIGDWGRGSVKVMERMILHVDPMAARKQMNASLSSMPHALLAEHLQSYNRFIGDTCQLPPFSLSQLLNRNFWEAHSS